MMETAPDIPNRSWRATLVHTPLGWAITIGAAAIGVYLLMSHTGHILSALPYLLLLACPLMHLFGHRSHYGDRGRDAA